MGQHRIFISIDIPEELKMTLEFFIAPFYKQNFVRVSEKEGWHITVVFCGYLNETEIETLKEILEKAVSHTKLFSLSAPVVLFAPENRPRMVWCRFQNSPFFNDLSREIGREMLEKQKEGFFMDFKRENREALPHITLARFGELDFRHVKDLLPAGGTEITEIKSFEPKTLNIMESFLGKGGAVYSVVKQFDF